MCKMDLFIRQSETQMKKHSGVDCIPQSRNVTLPGKNGQNKMTRRPQRKLRDTIMEDDRARR